MSSLVAVATRSVAIVTSLALSPVISGSLLAALATLPEPYRDELINRLNITSEAAIKRTKTVLQILLIFSAIRTVNRALNRWAGNNWRITGHPGWNWPEEVAVVTGGCSGIGEKLVEGLARRRVKVAVLDIQDLPVTMQGRNNIRFYKCDVSSSESIAATADAIRRDLGHPSILINNAGICVPHTILQIPEPTLRKVFDVNCISHWVLVQQFLPRMVELNKGHIVSIASMASFSAMPRSADYAATKAAVLAFHETLACEIKHFYKAPGVMTTIVHPSFVLTPLVERLASSAVKKGVRMLKSEDVATLILAQVFGRKGAQLILPTSDSFVTTLRAWPTWLQESLRDGMGKQIAKTQNEIA
ncbi:dehydrogenase/reductase SDR family member 8 precursor [Xylariales sp. PMI_506]|nr:dehydrogenase/reductase SDR family member 8 precursor [Xylariales sp. PMI_506]